MENVDLRLRSFKDFSGGPVGKTSPSNAGDVGSIPGWGAKITHALGPKPQNTKHKQYCNSFSKDFKNGPHKKEKVLKVLELLRLLGHVGRGKRLSERQLQKSEGTPGLHRARIQEAWQEASAGKLRALKTLEVTESWKNAGVHTQLEQRDLGECFMHLAREHIRPTSRSKEYRVQPGIQNCDLEIQTKLKELFPNKT